MRVSTNSLIRHVFHLEKTSGIQCLYMAVGNVVLQQHETFRPQQIMFLYETLNLV